MPKEVYQYPDEERLEVLILANSPCTATEILKLEKIPVKPNTLVTLKSRMDWLFNQGKVAKKRIGHGEIYWHVSIEKYKKKVLKRATEHLVVTKEDHVTF